MRRDSARVWRTYGSALMSSRPVGDTHMWDCQYVSTLDQTCMCGLMQHIDCTWQTCREALAASRGGMYQHAKPLLNKLSGCRYSVAHVLDVHKCATLTGPGDKRDSTAPYLVSCLPPLRQSLPAALPPPQGFEPHKTAPTSTQQQSSHDLHAHTGTPDAVSSMQLPAVHLAAPVDMKQTSWHEAEAPRQQ